MKITFLVDNKTEHPSCTAEWGLSMIVESCGHKVLYDTGASSMFLENARELNEDLYDIECAMISHGHYDHTGGIKSLLQHDNKIKIFMHKEGFGKLFGSENDEIDDYDCGSGFSDSFIEKYESRGNIIKTEGITQINECMTLVGNIPDIDGMPPTEKFYRLIDGKYVRDAMNHEQFLAVIEEDELHIISGCCHKGALPTVLYAKKLFPEKKIKSLIGGLHMYSSNSKQRKALSDGLHEAGVENIVPLHCTGMKTIIKLKEDFGKNCHIACSGDVLEL